MMMMSDRASCPFRTVKQVLSARIGRGVEVLQPEAVDMAREWSSAAQPLPAKEAQEASTNEDPAQQTVVQTTVEDGGAALVLLRRSEILPAREWVRNGSLQRRMVRSLSEESGTPCGAANLDQEAQAEMPPEKKSSRRRVITGRATATPAAGAAGEGRRFRERDQLSGFRQPDTESNGQASPTAMTVSQRDAGATQDCRRAHTKLDSSVEGFRADAVEECVSSPPALSPEALSPDASASVASHANRTWRGQMTHSAGLYQDAQKSPRMMEGSGDVAAEGRFSSRRCSLPNVRATWHAQSQSMKNLSVGAPNLLGRGRGAGHMAHQHLSQSMKNLGAPNLLGRGLSRAQPVGVDVLQGVDVVTVAPPHRALLREQRHLVSKDERTKDAMLRKLERARRFLYISAGPSTEVSIPCHSKSPSPAPEQRVLGGGLGGESFIMGDASPGGGWGGGREKALLWEMLEGGACSCHNSDTSDSMPAWSLDLAIDRMHLSPANHQVLVQNATD
jgi:hypothetical protein